MGETVGKMRWSSRRVAALLALLLAGGCVTTRHAQTANGRFREHEEVFAKPENVSLRATIFEPVDEGEALRPAVVLIHGGAWVSGGRYFRRWYGRRLAEHGYVVVSVTYRRMPSHPFPDCMHDVKAAVRWVRLNAERLRVDPDRIAALGDSAGGHLSLLLAVTGDDAGAEDAELEGRENPGPSSAVQAVVALYPPTDLTYYLDPHGALKLGGLTPAYMRRFVRGFGATSEEALRAASPISRVHAGVCPVLLIHGLDDPIVPYDQSQRMHRALRGAGVPARLISVPNRGHGFDYIHHDLRAKVFEEICAFLDDRLKSDAGAQAVGAGAKGAHG